MRKCFQKNVNMLPKKKDAKYITKDTEISFEQSDKKDSMKEILMKKILLKKILNRYSLM